MKVLLYHAVREDEDFPAAPGTNVTPERFERQLKYLRRHFSVIPLSEALATEGVARLAVTFDDGYRDNYQVVFPLLREFGIPATFFLTVAQIGRDWDFPHGPYPGLSWEEVREMTGDPRMEIGSHGLQHRDLTLLPPEEAAEEITLSKKMLEENLALAVRFFSYPHGNYNQAVNDLVRRAGYRAAFSVVKSDEDNFSRRRILISRRDNMFRFQLKLSPLYWPLRGIM